MKMIVTIKGNDGNPKDTTYQTVNSYKIADEITYESEPNCVDEQSFRRGIVSFFMGNKIQVLKIVRDWNE